jgi:hypothetical protein
MSNNYLFELFFISLYSAMNSDCSASTLDNIFIVKDRYLHASFFLRKAFLIKLQQLDVLIAGKNLSCDFAEKSFAFASGDPLHLSAFLPLAAIAFLLTTIKVKVGGRK